MSLPLDMFDALAFKAQLDNGKTIQCCKSAIASTTHYLHQQYFWRRYDHRWSTGIPIFVKKNFSLVIMAIIVLSVVPVAIELCRHRAGKSK